MRQRFGYGLGRYRAWLILLLAFFPVIPGMIFAQDGAIEGGAAFAGGQMIRGTVTAVAVDRITVKTEEGEVYQVAVSANTRVMKDRQPVKIADIKTGDGVGAMGVMDVPAKTVHAVFVAVMDAEQVKKAREGLGKVYITGTVTAVNMDDARITVKRPDGVSQTIQADEGTSFKRGGRRVQASVDGTPMAGTPAAGANAGGESITLADLKMGDLILGPGTVKSGMFVPTELRVIDAVARGQGRRRSTGNAGASAFPAGSPNADDSGVLNGKR
ncbi:MAG: hypothetical protein ABI380_02485 [Edaphobacter sp.]